MIMYIENPKECKKLELMSKFSQDTGSDVNNQKLILCL